MITHKAYFKQAAAGVVGHTYEHIVANAIHRQLIAAGYLPVLDFTLYAETFDGIVVISLDTTFSAIDQKFEDILHNEAITRDDALQAVSQLSSEFERTVQYDEAQLLRELQSLHAKPWIAQREYTRSRPITDLARELHSPALSFGRHAPRSFVTYQVIYQIVDCPYELKPLAVYLLQCLALAQIVRLYETLPYGYDIGDEWAQYQDTVGYLHAYRMPKRHAVTLADFEKLVQRHRQQIKTNGFRQKLLAFIKYDVAARTPYFNEVSMFAFAYQLIGAKGWVEILQLKHIDTLLSLVQIDVEQVNPSLDINEKGPKNQRAIV